MFYINDLEETKRLSITSSPSDFLFDVSLENLVLKNNFDWSLASFALPIVASNSKEIVLGESSSF